MKLERLSPCKVNLLLNILGRRPDGFHELETVMYPLNLTDRLEFDRMAEDIELTCSDPRLPVDKENLVFRAAAGFFEHTGILEGVRIYLEKRVPVAAGLGGGSGNAAATLLALNELFGQPVAAEELKSLAAGLGSDVPFFLQSKPALATGRGEIIQPLDFFPALRGTAMLLVYPGFGVSTPWAYGQLANFPDALQGRPGRAQELLAGLGSKDLRNAAPHFYNALEAPVFRKYPLLAIFQEFLRANGALVALMSGSGSTTFAIVENERKAQHLKKMFQRKFDHCWAKVVAL